MENKNKDKDIDKNNLNFIQRKKSLIEKEKFNFLEKSKLSFNIINKNISKNIYKNNYSNIKKDEINIRYIPSNSYSNFISNSPSPKKLNLNSLEKKYKLINTLKKIEKEKGK
jgi:hypothetical protein